VGFSLHLGETAALGAFSMAYSVCTSASWRQRCDDSLHGSLLTGWAGYLCTRLVPYRRIVGKLDPCTDVELLPKPVQHPMSLLIANNPKEGCPTPVLCF